MKKFALFMLLLAASTARAQQSGNGPPNLTCNAANANQTYLDNLNQVIYTCRLVNGSYIWQSPPVPATGVTKIDAGTGITVSPTGGTGDVTVNASASGTVSTALAGQFAIYAADGTTVSGTNAVRYDGSGNLYLYEPSILIGDNNTDTPVNADTVIKELDVPSGTTTSLEVGSASIIGLADTSLDGSGVGDISLTTNYSHSGNDSGNILLSANSTDPSNGGKIELSATGGVTNTAHSAFGPDAVIDDPNWGSTILGLQQNSQAADASTVPFGMVVQSEWDPNTALTAGTYVGSSLLTSLTMNLDGQVTSYNEDVDGAQFYVTNNSATVGSSGGIYAVYGSASNANAGTLSHIVGFSGGAANLGSGSPTIYGIYGSAMGVESDNGSVTLMADYLADNMVVSGGTATDVAKFYAGFQNAVSTATVTNMYDYYAGNLLAPVSGGAVHNAYGLYVGSVAGGDTKNYEIYTAGSASSYFTGPITGPSHWTTQPNSGSNLCGSATLSGTNWSGSGLGPYTHTSGTTALTASGCTALVAGQSYQVTWVQVAAGGGTVTPSFGGLSGSAQTASNTYTYYATATSTATIAFTPTTGFTGSVTLGSVVAQGPKATSCGTPVIARGSTDRAGKLTTAVSGCVLTFQNAYTNAPACMFMADNSITGDTSQAVTNTSLTVTATSMTSFDYQCTGLNE